MQRQRLLLLLVLSDDSSASLSDCCIGTSASAAGAASATPPTSSVGGSAAGGSATPSAAASTGAPPVRTAKWATRPSLATLVHLLGLGPPAPRRWTFGNAACRLRAVREPPMGMALSAELSWRGDGCAEVRGALSRLTGRGDGGSFYMGWEGSSRRPRTAAMPRRLPLPDVSDGRPSKWY